jgi:1-acyl-sn-glycerol-3-phosphate acyltransferase
MLDALQRGKSLVVFPEGTRGSGEKLLSFKTGLFHVAREMPAVELVPVWITNAHRVMPKGALLPVPMLCTVTFGPPTHIEDEEGKPEFLDRLRRHLLRLSTV